MASVMARQTTYCIRGSFRASSICEVKENMRHPGGDSHTFFERPLPLNCTSATQTTPTGSLAKFCVTRSCVEASLGDQSIHLPKRDARSAAM
ncbi:Os02g0166950 [Oryza sativa Japonica Group]|uniref:Os02g0166950 protein n=1 Tax=Oryza sativa subsp. japonica TaxID=39947 RepID=A0A0P0VF88_ORYSJ|nr:hypothetical protein EE612_009071 [Oryza sativa]BAS77158.1 Os02g0166950 [Oryza sativa Japonica Group]